MAAAKDLEVQKKRAVQSPEESTVPANMFVPITDIFETDDSLRVLVEMPGVDKQNVDISVKDRILTIEGRIDFQKYAGMTPVYTESASAIIIDGSRSRTKSIPPRSKPKCATAC
jgi:HSP20 family protein